MIKENFSKLLMQSKGYGKSNIFASFHTLFDLSLFALALSLSLSENTLLWITGQVLLFFSIWRSFSILHSCVHNAFFKSRNYNDFFGKVFSIIALTPYNSWKKAHLQHHKFPRHRELDPSLCLPSKEDISPKVKKTLDFCWKYKIPIFSFLVTVLKDEKSNKEEGDFSTYLVLGFHLFLLLILQGTYFKVFLLPYLLYLWTADLVIISQHNIFPDVQEDQLRDLKLKDHDLVTRTVKLPELFGRFVLLNFDLHTLHHMLPNLAHYHLRKIDRGNIEEIEFWPWYKKIRNLPGHRVYLD